MQRAEIDAKVNVLLDAFIAGQTATTVQQRKEADEAGRAIIKEIAVDVLYTLSRIAEALEAIAANSAPQDLFVGK